MNTNFIPANSIKSTSICNDIISHLVGYFINKPSKLKPITEESIFKDFTKIYNETNDGDIDFTQDTCVTPTILVEYCKKKDISVYAFNSNNDLYEKYLSKNKNRRALIFYTVDEYFYIINDPTIFSKITHKYAKKTEKLPSLSPITDLLINNIKRKLLSCKNRDIKQLKLKGNASPDDILQLLEKQHNTCYVCNEEVLTLNWKNRCLYQFSIDRIDESFPHDRNNVLISCYFCNCRHRIDEEYKICTAGCHTEPKDIIWRNQVDKTIINNLLLR
jgi:hypothetical protein